MCTRKHMYIHINITYTLPSTRTPREDVVEKRNHCNTLQYAMRTRKYMYMCKTCANIYTRLSTRTLKQEGGGKKNECNILEYAICTRKHI